MGGLIKFNLPVNDKLLLDFNDIKAGISLSSEDAINTPLGEKKTGTAVTFADNTGKIRLSLFGTWDGSSLYVRFLGVDSWKKIQLFGN